MFKVKHIARHDSEIVSSRLGLRKFNFRLLARLTGILLIYLSASMLLPTAISLYCHDGAFFALTFSATIILMIGLFLRNMLGRNATYELLEDESYWVTLAVWIAVPLCGTLPYLFTGGLPSFTDALFESMSGFTTTGSSVTILPQEMPPSLLVYRSFTQWVGGLGLMLFVVAILRRLTLGANQLYEAEFSGTQQRKLHPRLARSVTRMWTIYSILTLLLMIILLFTGSTPIDSLCLSFSTISTGGFVTHSEGLSLLSSGALAAITVFMFLSGVNLALLYRFFTFRWRRIGHDEEFRVYLVVFLTAVATCALALALAGNSVGTAVQYSIFHIASTMSTCGFYLPRPSHWSLLVSALTFILIVMGASAGSSGGGIKLRRIIILAKYVGNYCTRMLHPHAIFRVKVNDEVVEHTYIHKVFAFVSLYILFIILGAFVLTLCGCSIPDSVCMAAANISNLGPSPLINNLGGHLDYFLLPAVGKWVLAILMLAGRLELFALIAIFSPSYWRRGRHL